MRKEETKRVIDWSLWAGVTVVGPGKGKNSRMCQFNSCGCLQEIYVETRHANKPNCKSCEKKRLVDEAGLLGLVYLDAARKKPYSKRRYKFIKCGHEQEIDYGSVRKGFLPTCFECLHNQRHEDANSVGLLFKGKGRNRNYGFFQFKDCEHEKEFTYTSIKKLSKAGVDTAYCDVCRVDRLKAEAALANLQLMGPGLQPKHFRYKFLICGHTQEIIPQHVKEQKNYKCKQCFDEKLKQEASASGLELIGVDFVRGATNYRKYKILKCGHIQTMQHGLAKRGGYVCNICENTVRTIPSQIYLLHIEVNGIDWLKLGYSRDIQNRVKQYGLPNNAKIKLICTVQFPTGKKAHEVEASLHKKFNKQKLSKTKMFKFHQAQGASECYPASLKARILTALEMHDTISFPDAARIEVNATTW